jgi:hypothetical protein
MVGCGEVPGGEASTEPEPARALHPAALHPPGGPQRPDPVEQLLFSAAINQLLEKNPNKIPLKPT